MAHEDRLLLTRRFATPPAFGDSLARPRFRRSMPRVRVSISMRLAWIEFAKRVAANYALLELDEKQDSELPSEDARDRGGLSSGT